MELPIRLQAESAEPLYHQIKVQLRALIISGQLEQGTLLPSIRELAQQLSCSVITVRRVYHDLEAEQLLRTRQGTGTFVAQTQQEQYHMQRLAQVEAAFEAAFVAARQVRCTRAELEEIIKVKLERYTAAVHGQSEAQAKGPTDGPAKGSGPAKGPADGPGDDSAGGI